MTGYVYDWTTDPPTTDDPGCLDLARGGHNVVTCDGRDIGDVRRFKTGPDGWVEAVKLRADGSPITEIYLLETGEVVYPDAHDQPSQVWQSKVPQPDGTWKDKYGERVALAVIRGHVVYTDTRVVSPVATVGAS